MSSFVLKKTPIGPLDSDSSEFVLPGSSTRFRLNLRCGSGSDKGTGMLTNISGNTQISFDLPISGTNKCIGNFTDEKDKKCYIFNYNSDGYHGIYEFDYILNTVTPVLISRTDSLDVDILQFSESQRINHINIANGEDLVEDEEVEFSLTTANGLTGTTAELISTETLLTESDGTGGTVSTTSLLKMKENVVKVSTNQAVALSISVNGELRDNDNIGVAGTWEEFFVVRGFGDISVVIL